MDEVKDSLRKRQKSRTIDDDDDDDDEDDDDDVLKEFKAPEKRRKNKYGLSIYNWCDFAEARLKKLKGEARLDATAYSRCDSYTAGAVQESKRLTTTMGPDGSLLEYNSAPMGLRISSDFVQSCMEEILHGLDVVVYINDLDVLYSHHDGGNDTLQRRLG